MHVWAAAMAHLGDCALTASLVELPDISHRDAIHFKAGPSFVQGGCYGALGQLCPHKLCGDSTSGSLSEYELTPGWVPQRHSELHADGGMTCSVCDRASKGLRPPPVI